MTDPSVGIRVLVLTGGILGAFGLVVGAPVVFHTVRYLNASWLRTTCAGVGRVDCKHNWASVAWDLQRRVEALAARVGKERTE